MKDSTLLECGEGDGSVCLKDSHNGYTVKVAKQGWYNAVLKKEYQLLVKLAELKLNFVPRVYYYNSDILIMDYCGERVTKETYSEVELIEMLERLKEIRLTHNDIHKDNLLSKNGKMYLIDFGHAHWIGKGKRVPNIYPDDRAIGRFRKTMK